MLVSNAQFNPHVQQSTSVSASVNNSALKIVGNGTSSCLARYKITTPTRRCVMFPEAVIVFNTHSEVPAIKQQFQEHQQLLGRFLRGEVTADAVRDNVRDVFQTVLNVNIANGLISADNPEETKRALLSSFANMRVMMMWQVYVAHETEGRQIAMQHGFRDNANGWCWLHYNSDFYFFEKELIEIINGVASEFLAKHGFDNVDLDEVFRNARSSPNGVGALSFNELWSARHKGQRLRIERTSPLFGDLRDVTISPPRGFMLFIGDTTRIASTFMKGGVEHVGELERISVFILNGRVISSNGEFADGMSNFLEILMSHRIDDGTVFGFLKNFSIIRSLTDSSHNNIMEAYFPMDAYFRR